jgi:GNAT superfamily N-acetyltransferase
MPIHAILVLSFFFVDPYYQRQGIGSLLLKWGKEKADESGAKKWLTSTPQAVPVYQKNGWEVMDIYDIDLEKHSGEGHYIRSWMLRFGES